MMIKLHFYTALLCAGLSLCLLGRPRPASAQLLSSISVNQNVSENDPTNTYSQNVTDTTAPFQQTATVGDAYGTLTAIYNLTDNENVATYTINCSGSETSTAYGISEGTTNDATNFFLTRPVNYSFVITENGGPNIQDSLQFNVDAIIVNTTIYDSSKTYTGTLQTGLFTLQEGWGLESNGLNTPVAQSGTDSISITFTAVTPIPEPSSAALIGIPAAATLARRRRRLGGGTPGLEKNDR